MLSCGSRTTALLISGAGIREHSAGKSTLLEGIAVLAGYDQAGGGKGYMPADHSLAIESTGGLLAQSLKAAWLPKITNGWFFRAESFFTVARYLDEAAREPGSGPPPDFLSHSHGEGFLRFFEERCQRQGIFIFDEPESALSPSRQIEFLKLLRRMDQSGNCQVIMATHAPILMAYPNARLLGLTKSGLAPVTVEATEHYRTHARVLRRPGHVRRREIGGIERPRSPAGRISRSGLPPRAASSLCAGGAGVQTRLGFLATHLFSRLLHQRPRLRRARRRASRAPALRPCHRAGGVFLTRRDTPRTLRLYGQKTGGLAGVPPAGRGGHVEDMPPAGPRSRSDR